MPAHSSRYSSLRAQPRLKPAPDFELASLFPVDRAHPFFRVEAEKLQAMKASLWIAFSAQTVDSSAPLVDLTTAYTGALGLQLDMIDRASVSLTTQEVEPPIPRVA
jgi:hypothetical protein